MMHHPTENIRILVAEDNHISRELMISILKTHGFDTIPVCDGEEAIAAIEEQIPDLAFVDLNMEPKGGFSFVQYLIAYDIDLPVIIITADESTDVLTKAQKFGVMRVMQKPVEPERLIAVTKAILKRHGHNLSVLTSRVYNDHYSPEQLMQRAIDLAEKNAKSRKGGPFGAVVSAQDGTVSGEGVSGLTSRIDPTAHAEVMAIRQAAEKLNRSDLSDCVLYCSSEPTMIGKALITSVGIKQVYYALTHDDIAQLREKEQYTPEQTAYRQLGRDDALKMFGRWEAMEDKYSSFP